MTPEPRALRVSRYLRSDRRGARLGHIAEATGGFVLNVVSEDLASTRPRSARPTRSGSSSPPAVVAAPRRRSTSSASCCKSWSSARSATRTWSARSFTSTSAIPSTPRQDRPDAAQAAREAGRPDLCPIGRIHHDAGADKRRIAALVPAHGCISSKSSTGNCIK